MAEEKTAIKIIPTPATHDISQHDLLRLARITRIPVEKIRERFSRGKGLTIVTTAHPKVAELVELIKSFGFSVITGVPKENPSAAPHGSSPTAPTQRVLDENEWAIGDVIENLYEVRDIKHGGMGAVYVVHHKRWNTMMAVKSLLKRLQDREEDRALFLKEAETWIDIGFHPNIAACYYVRNIRENPRIFIEYVDGGALNQWLNERPKAGWDVILDLMAQFSDGLQHAHAKGLVHRDVKPGNCMMTKGGILKVTDFGLTKRRTLETSGYSNPDAMGTESFVPDRESITAAGMGTPGYMAPEMWVPHADVGPAADIYAFGVMLFEICCGRKPFVIKPGDRRDKLAMAHVRKPPPDPSSIRKDIPLPIEELILECLRKHPSERPASFRHVRNEIARIYEQVIDAKFPREAPDEVRLLADALNNRAVSLMDLNHQEEAQMALAKALQSDPHHPEAVYNHGLLEWQRTGDPDWDLVMLLEEVTKAPEYQGRGAHLLGRCLLTLGDPSRALKACELAISADESAGDRLKPFAIALIGSGRDEDAITHLQTYLQEVPQDEEALAWLIGALVRTGRREEAKPIFKTLRHLPEFTGMRVDDVARTYVYTGLSETLTFKGHGGWITAACEFPKSQLLMTGSRDRTLKIWDATTGNEQRSVGGMAQPPVSLWISPDERMTVVVTAQAGPNTKVLDLESGRFVGNPLSHEGLVTALGFSPDGKALVTVDQKGMVRIWDTERGKVASTFKVPLHTAAAIIKADPDEPDILIAAMDRTLKHIRGRGSNVETFERGHRDPITMLKVDPQGKRALSCGKDRQVIAWDVQACKQVTSFQIHQEQISEVALNPVKDLAASYDTKSGIKLWDTTTGEVLRSFSTGDSEMLTLSFTKDGTHLFAGGRDMMLHLWEVGGKHVVPALALAKIRPVTKQMRSDRRFKALFEKAKLAMKKGAFRKAYALIRETQNLAGYERTDLTLDLLLRMKDHGTRAGIHGGWKKKSFETQSGVMDVAFSPSAINFLTAQGDHTIRLWSAKSGECLKNLKGHTNVVACVRFAVNGREAASGGDDRSVRVWDLNTGRNLLALKGHVESVSSVAYSRDGLSLISGSWDETVRVWRLPDGAAMKTLKGQDDKITAVEFVPESEYALSAGFEGSIKMWDLSASRIVRDLRGHQQRVGTLRISPRGDLLLSVSMDGTARIWDLRRGQCLQVLEASKQGLRAGGFSPDQRFVVTGGDDTVLRVWTVETGELQREFQGHSREITSAEFSSNGRFMISSCLDGAVLIWEVDWEWAFNRQEG